MLNSLIDWFSRLASSWKFWIVVPPWDVGVRVRLGRVAASLEPGLHFRIPGLDEIVLVNTRLRVDSTPSVTIGNGKPGWARTASATVGYRVANPVAALMHFTDPGPVLVGLAQRELTRGTDELDALQALAQAVATHGVIAEFVYFAEDVELRVFRIMNGVGGVFASSGGCYPTPAGQPAPTRY